MNRSYEREKGLWNSIFREYTPFDLRDTELRVDPVFDEALEQFTYRTSRILDFGCGTGDISFQCLQYDSQKIILGLDMAEVGINFAKETARLSGYAGADFEIGGIEKLREIPDRSYDGIILSNVLDVMPKDVSEETVAELERIIIPGGLWFLKFNPYYDKEELREMGYTKKGYNIYEEDNVMHLRQASSQYWKQKLSLLGDELIYLEFEYPWQPGLNRLFVIQDRGKCRNY